MRPSQIELRLTRRPDGMIVYSREGPGAFTSEFHLIPERLDLQMEKLEAQMMANGAMRSEAEKAVAECFGQGFATLAFPVRSHRLFAGFPPIALQQVCWVG